MSRFLFDLSDERRAVLEQYRATWGLRSLSAALQHMIDNSDDIGHGWRPLPAGRFTIPPGQEAKVTYTLDDPATDAVTITPGKPSYVDKARGRKK